MQDYPREEQVQLVDSHEFTKEVRELPQFYPDAQVSDLPARLWRWLSILNR